MILKSIPNILTVLRILVVVPFCYALLYGHMKLAFWLFFIAGWTDLLDGYLARHFEMKTKLGAILDPIADKLLVGASYILMAYMGYLPLWLVVVIMVREIGIFFGLLAYYYCLGMPNIKPNLISKLNTMLLILLVGDVLLNASFITMPLWLTNGLIISVVITTIGSYGLYMITGFARLKRYRERTSL